MENQTLPEGGEEIKTSKVGTIKNLVQKAKEYKKGVGIFALLVIIAGALYYYKGIFVAAAVDGAFISRWSVISELEKQGGKQALESIITERLIMNEARAQNISVSDDEVNQEVSSIEARVASQGGTLEAALLMQGMTVETLRAQIRIQKQIEKILGSKIAVTDDEVQKYITDNKAPIPKEKEAEIAMRTSIHNQLKNEKLNKEVRAFIASLKDKATIKYYANY